jgi:hypothetical protein
MLIILVNIIDLFWVFNVYFANQKQHRIQKKSDI